MVSYLRETFVRLKKQPDKVKLNDFFELLVCKIEDLQDEVKKLTQEVQALKTQTKPAMEG